MGKSKTKGGFYDGFMSKDIDTIDLIKCIIRNKAEKLAFDLYLSKKPTKDDISGYITKNIVPYIEIIYENFLKCIKILSSDFPYMKYEYEKKQGRSFTQLGYLIHYLNNRDNNINFGNYNNEAYIIYCLDNPIKLFRNKCYFNDLLIRAYLSLENFIY